MKLLLIEDNNDIAELIFDYFEQLKYELDYASNGVQGLQLATQHQYDCVILDIMLPGIDGIELCEQLRCDGNNTPIIMLTARDSQQDVLRGFNGGADDYVVKPFELEVLEARIKALFRRSEGIGFQKEIVCGEININLVTRTAFRNSTALKLNPTCYSILLFLAKNHPQPSTKQELERHLWGEELPDQDVLRKHIYQLRTIVDKPFLTKVIKTIPKIGYSIDCKT